MKKIQFTRRFSCDKSISKGVLWLNQNDFFTLSSCSGLESEHKSSERDRMYLEFEALNFNKLNQVRIIAKETRFTIKNRHSTTSIRIETENENKLEMFNDFIDKLKANKGKLNLRAMGISNSAYDSINKKFYSVQYYDYDYNGESKIPRTDLLKILEIFPYDCLMYESKHGIHFISFSVLHGRNITKARVLETSKALGKQDYWSEGKDLTLRVSSKWKPRSLRNYKNISSKPIFKGLIQKPNQYRISKKHLEFYKKYMNLPLWVYNYYNDCVKMDLTIKLYHYKTRD